MSHLASMTGFGKASGSGSRGEEVVAEVRSFNSKSFKLSVRLPGIFAPHEEAVRALVRKHIRRGSVALTVRFRSPADLPDVRINTQLLEKYARELKALGERLPKDTRIDLAQLANLPGAVELLEAEREASGDEVRFLLKHIEAALVKNGEARRREGESLAADLEARARAALALVEKIRERAPKVVEIFRERLHNRMKELLAGTGGIPPEVIQTEAAVFAERSDIHEECVRAESHIRNFLDLLAKGGELGRRLDFVAQEIHRELSTINAKANDYGISEMAVEAKTEIDKIKEQVQNVE